MQMETPLAEVTRKSDGTTTTGQERTRWTIYFITTDSNGTVTDKHFCDKIANSATPTTNQNQQNVAGAKESQGGSRT